ncbi:MAG TPA: hypothetical protein VE084_13410 [Burkholderiaceae bacterium]|nr:hypothetical protein [Burkholderiaceae bacterium]
MTIDPTTPASGAAPRPSPSRYRGVDIRIDVERTPDCTFGRADLFEDTQFRGRLSIGSPDATPEDVANRLARLARAKVDIWRSVQRHRRSAH